MPDESKSYTTRTAGGLHRRDFLKSAIMAGAGFAAATC